MRLRRHARYRRHRFCELGLQTSHTYVLWAWGLLLFDKGLYLYLRLHGSPTVLGLVSSDLGPDALKAATHTSSMRWKPSLRARYFLPGMNNQNSESWTNGQF